MLTVGLLVAVIALLADNARHVDWAGVLTSLRNYEASTLALAAALTACSFAVYSCFDLLVRSYTKAHMSVASVMTVTFVSHALGLNLGVAGVALRFRLYGAYGIESAVVARIWGVSIVTNWLGFLVLGGVIFTGQLIALPASSMLGAPIGATAMRGVGLALLAATALYLAGCALAKGRGFFVFGRPITVPSFRFAALQFILSALNWTLIASVMFVLLRGQIDFPTVLGVYLLSAIALSVVDVPGGLGVTEAVFLALLGSRVPITELLAALVVYRAVFYLAPMLPALMAYVAIEMGRRARSVAVAAGLRP
ncbi:lysylphosphatidylglycerol synthase domain-containing protein [soil metagenome]